MNKQMEDIRDLTIDELKTRLEDSNLEYANLRFQHATHQLQNPLLLRSKRREVARLKTVIHEFDMGTRKPKQVQG